MNMDYLPLKREQPIKAFTDHTIYCLEFDLEESSLRGIEMKQHCAGIDVS